MGHCTSQLQSHMHIFDFSRVYTWVFISIDTWQYKYLNMHRTEPAASITGASGNCTWGINYNSTVVTGCMVQEMFAGCWPSVDCVRCPCVWVRGGAGRWWSLGSTVCTGGDIVAFKVLSGRGTRGNQPTVPLQYNKRCCTMGKNCGWRKLRNIYTTSCWI